MMLVAEIAHHTASFGKSRSFSGIALEFSVSPYSSIVPVYFSRQTKNNLVAKPNVIKDGWVVFVVREQLFTHFSPVVIIFFSEVMWNLCVPLAKLGKHKFC